MKNRRHCLAYDLARLTESSATDTLTKYARKRGWVVARVFMESSEKRQTQFRKLLRVVRPDDTVLVASLSRLPNGVQSLRLLVELFERGRLGSIVLATEGIVFSRTNRACRRYVQLLNAQEQSEKQLRVLRSRIALRIASLLAVQVAERQRKITPEIEKEILRLRFEENLPIRAITRKIAAGPVRISRGSVQGVLRRHRSKALKQ